LHRARSRARESDRDTATPSSIARA
jgi:hypothetical protein